MATIICRACHRSFEGEYDPLGVCPHCGGSLAPPPQTMDAMGRMDLRQVAKRQRLLLWFILVLLGFQLLLRTSLIYVARGVDIAFFLLYAAVLSSILVSVLRLLAAMRVHMIVRILLGVLMIAPCINLLVLMFINGRATRALGEAGLRVGLMGVKDADVLRRMSVHLCHKCSYDLTGNTSGRCPECGTPIEIGVAREPARTGETS